MTRLVWFRMLPAESVMMNPPAPPARSHGGNDAHPEMVPVHFVSRPNRFLVVARFEDGAEVSAYLPNTGRLSHLMTSGRRLLLRRDGGPHRRTEFTVTRAWDGCWVALEASRAPLLLAQWLQEGNPFPDFGHVDEIRSEVSVLGHRLDLLLGHGTETMWVEVKSGGRAENETALLSMTPSTRGVSHLSALARLVEGGESAAAAFVIQRDDVRTLLVGGDADQGWIEAVESARDAGVSILAFGCDVTETDVRLARVLPVTWSQ